MKRGEGEMTDTRRRGALHRLAAWIESRDNTPAPAIAPDRGELAALRERVDSLEAMVEGLQDALYRQAVHHDDQIDDLVRRTSTEEVARSLSADARRRGL
jgi:hypothetical protein